MLERLDGLVIAGGADVEPARYDADAAPDASQEPRPDRDALELALAAASAETGPAGARHLPRHAGHGGRRPAALLDQHLPDGVGHDAHSPGAGGVRRARR